MTEEYPQTVPDLLARMAAARGALEAVLAPLTEEELSRPAKDGGWSVKDHLFHLAAWMRKQLAVIDQQAAWTSMGIDEQTYQAGLEPVNAALARRSQHMTAAEALDEFHKAYEAIARRIEQLTDADLRRVNNTQDPLDTRYLIEGIASNTYEHDEEHRVWIEEHLRA